MIKGSVFIMSKQLKSSTDNQWASQSNKPFKSSTSKGKEEKTETDNQWTTTVKNNTPEK